jgi:hypothetical protein
VKADGRRRFGRSEVNVGGAIKVLGECRCPKVLIISCGCASFRTAALPADPEPALSQIPTEYSWDNRAWFLSMEKFIVQNPFRDL